MGASCSSAEVLAQNPAHQGGGVLGRQHKVLFFPDAALPCRYGAGCKRRRCEFAHRPTNLSAFLDFLRFAKTSLDICVFTITCNDIAEVILALHRSGKVKVRIITDTQQQHNAGSDIREFRDAGVPVREDHQTSHMHHKFALIDNRILLTGSFNWTRSAVLHNKENVLCTDVPGLVQPFRKEFAKLWGQFRP
jgi:cardiolipin hydrolase